MAASDNIAYRFGDWLVEPVLNRVTREGEEHQVEPLTMDVLAYLLSHPGQVVSSDEMLDALWGDRHGDPGMIQQRISQLRRVLGGEQSAYIETIRRRGYRAVANVEVIEESGPQPTVGEAESSPEGSAIENTRAPDRSISRFKIAIGGVLLVGVAVALWIGLGTNREAEVVPVADPIIAVLPFENLSPDADNAFFADGMHSEVLSNLTRVSGLKIISRASVMRYRDTEKGLPQIAEELGVNYFLAGDVQRSGERVRIGVQLIEAAGEHQLWADNYDRELADIFKVQSDVARGVANELKVALDIGTMNAIAAGKTDSIYAYQLYLRGQELRSETSQFEEALALYQEAVAIDPEFAQAYAGIAWTYRHLASKNLEWTAIKDEVIAAAERGYELDPFDPDVVMGMVSIYSVDVNQNEESFKNMVRYVDEALALAPNHRQALQYKASLANLVGDHETASAAQRLILELDPLDPETNFMMAEKRRVEGRFEEAREHIEKYVAVSPPGNSGVRAGLFYQNMGDLYHAVKYMHVAKQVDTENLYPPFYLGQWLFFMGETQAVDRLTQEMIQIAPTHEFTFFARSGSPWLTQDESTQLMAEWKARHPQSWFHNLIAATGAQHSGNLAFDEEQFAAAEAHYESFFQVVQEMVQASMIDGELIVGGNAMFLDRYALAAKMTGREELWREMTAVALQYFAKAPEKDHFQLMVLHAMNGNIPEAVKHFSQVPNTQQMIPVSWRESLYGITKDRHGAFNGLGNDIAFQQLLQEFRDSNADALRRVKMDFPDLFTADIAPSP